MDLHYSQTLCHYGIKEVKFHYLMDLHYSQTYYALLVEYE
mgnify:CR=1 FL=1